MRVSADVGGTFTDLVVETAPDCFRLFKTPTTPQDPALGVFNALKLAASGYGSSLEQFLSGVDMLIHATTRATNAMLTNTTARTAFLTTEGHPDILLFREGGRAAVQLQGPFPAPVCPAQPDVRGARARRFDGQRHAPLDEAALRTDHRAPASSARSRRSASVCCGRSGAGARVARRRAARAAPPRHSRTRCPTASIPRSASTAGPRSTASTPRSSR